MILCNKVHPTVDVTNALLWVSMCVSIARLTSSGVRLCPCPRRTRYSISSLHLDCAVAGSQQMRKIRVACENAIALLT